MVAQLGLDSRASGKAEWGLEGVLELNSAVQSGWNR